MLVQDMGIVVGLVEIHDPGGGLVPVADFGVLIFWPFGQHRDGKNPRFFF